jgi:hypothetical protein
MLRDLRDKPSPHLLSRLGVRIANRTCPHLRLRITWPVRRLMRALYPVEPASTSSGRIVSVVTVGRPSGARHHNSSDLVAVPSCSAAGCRRTSVKMRALSRPLLAGWPATVSALVRGQSCRLNSLTPRPAPKGSCIWNCHPEGI